MSLVDIASGLDTDKNTTHSYLPVYEKYLTSRRTTAKHVLELGVQTGGSLLLWQRYFPHAEIYGVDIDISKNQIHNEPRIHITEGDAYTDTVMQELGKRTYDVIVDDGPHSKDSMLYFAKHYTRMLNKDGILIIEDVQDIAWKDDIINAFPEEYRSNIKVLDRRSVKNRYDDILVVLDLKETETV